MKAYESPHQELLIGIEIPILESVRQYLEWDRQAFLNIQGFSENFNLHVHTKIQKCVKLSKLHAKYLQLFDFSQMLSLRQREEDSSQNLTYSCLQMLERDRKLLEAQVKDLQVGNSNI